MSSSHVKPNQTTVLGNSIDIEIDPYHCDHEIRTDIMVSEFTSIRLWGQIISCHGNPVPNALVKLVKICGSEDSKTYEGIAHTTSDCEGFYQFDIYSDEHAWYKILVGKSNTGKEIIVNSSTYNSPAYTNDPTYDPYSSQYTPEEEAYSQNNLERPYHSPSEAGPI